jgi:predicted ribosomally synthesized peptide with nif11-like leader
VDRALTYAAARGEGDATPTGKVADAEFDAIAVGKESVMSISEVRRFASDLQTDPALRAEIDKQSQSAPESLDGVVALAASKGYGFTAEELRASVRFADALLSDDDLDRVAAAAPVAIDPSIASLLKPWVRP